MTRRRGTITEQGLGWQHQKQRAKLIRRHIDGAPCWWCGEPMYVEPRRNPDYRPGVRAAGALHADHQQARANGGSVADRLLHGDCNSERGDGSRDHLRPALKRVNGGHPGNSMAWDTH